MTLPATIRVNVNVPFPAFVLGGGLITVGKNNGTWQIGFSVTNVAKQTPSATQQLTDYVLAWDSLQQTFFLMQLSLLTGGKLQRLITSSANLPVASTDAILNFNISVSIAVTVPVYSSRAGAPLTFKDVAGNLGPGLTITLNRTGSDTFDGATSIVLNQPYQGVTLVPANDGTSTGYSIE